MSKTSTKLSAFCFAAIMASCVTGPARAAESDYPTRPIRLVVPFLTGGPTDLTARLFAERMRKDLGQVLVIENRPGADSAIGAQQVARAVPDGYTLLFAMDVTLVMNPVTKTGLSYDPLQDFDMVSLTSFNTSILVVPADGPKTVEELIVTARANPGKLNYGAGIVTTRLAGYLFSKLAGIDAVYIPYKGSADIAAAILNGSIQYAVDGVAAHSGLIQGGKVRALAKLNKRPLASMPELKPLDEVANMPQLGEISTWAGIIGPRGLSPQVVERLQKATAGAANDEEVKKKLLDVGIVATSNTPDEFRSYVKTELGKWAAVVRDGGIKFVD